MVIDNDDRYIRATIGGTKSYEKIYQQVETSVKSELI